MSFKYDYPRPALGTDAVIFRPNEEGSRFSELLLIKRGKEPFKGQYALPGGFANLEEPALTAAARELQEETGLVIPEYMFKQVGAFDTPGRDPRGWTLSIAFTSVVSRDEEVKGADDAEEAEWVDVGQVIGMSLAFDHLDIVRAAAEFWEIEELF